VSRPPAEGTCRSGPVQRRPLRTGTPFGMRIAPQRSGCCARATGTAFVKPTTWWFSRTSNVRLGRRVRGWRRLGSREQASLGTACRTICMPGSGLSSSRMVLVIWVPGCPGRSHRCRRNRLEL